MDERISYAPDYVWRRVERIKPGDRVNWWGQDALVKNTRAEAGTIIITVADQVTGRDLDLPYRTGEQLSVLDPARPAI